MEYGYYRTAGGAEVDLVLEGEFGILPVEIKRTSFVDARRLQPLRDFMAGRRCPFGLVLHNGERPTLIEKNIIALPVACF